MGRKLFYKPGSFYRTDDRTGFPQRAERTRSEWNGLIVDESVWEARQPQDLVKGVPDDQTVPMARPLAPNFFVGPTYIALSANVAIGATFLPLQYIAGLSAGDPVGVIMDSGIVFMTTVSGPPISAGINIAAPMPNTAASGNLVANYTESISV